MADQKLKLVLLGEDRTASKSLKGVGTQAGQTGGKLSKLGSGAKIAGAAIGAGLLVAADAAIRFGDDSLKAFAGADKSQKQLEDAYKRFPKIADVNIDSLRKLNDAIQRKTGADGDDIASGQAVLARYKLTGKQLKAMTPLLVDYATRTGKSIPDAAKALGKAVGGSSKVAKEMGFSFKDAKDNGKNFDQVMAGLQGTVGGYAEKVPDAEKKSKILAASFGDLQEAAGEKLQPAMMGLTDAGQGVLDWLNENPAAMEGASAAWDLFMMGLSGLWDVVRKLILPALVMVNEYGVRPFVQGLAVLFDALSNVPGFEWAKTAAGKLREVDTAIGAVDKGLSALGEDKPKIDVDDSRIKAKTKKIDDQIAKLKKQKIKLVADGDTKGADRLAKKIRDLENKKHKVSVGVGFTKSGKQRVTINKGNGSTLSMRYTASGHPSLPSGGLTMVGDGMGHSPEALMLPTGSRVLSAGQTRAAQNQAANAGSGGGGDEFNFYAAPGVDLRALGRVVEKALIQVQQSRNGRPYQFKTKA